MQQTKQERKVVDPFATVKARAGDCDFKARAAATPNANRRERQLPPLPICSQLDLLLNDQSVPPPPPPSLKMKCFAVILAAVFAASVNADACDILKLAPLLSDPNVTQCKADSGFVPPIPPKGDQIPKVCASKACLGALKTLKGLGLGDCTVAGVRLETDLIGPIEKSCSAPPPGPAPTTVAPSPGPGPAPTKPTDPSAGPTPAPKPVC